MQHYDITIGPNQIQKINAVGQFIYFMPGGSAGGADTTITLRKVSGSDTVLLMPGQGLPIKEEGGMSEWIIGNFKNQGTITGRLLFCDLGFTDNRVSGSVEVIDGSKNRTMAQVAFQGAASLTPTAGKYATIQIFNPGTSQKNIFVEGVKTFAGGAIPSGIAIGYTQTQLATLTASVPASKKAGGVASVVQIRTESAVGAVAGWNALITMSEKDQYKFIEHILLPPGWGLVFQAQTADQAIQAAAEFFEEGV